MLTIIVPCCNEANNIPIIYSKVNLICVDNNIPFNFIFVDDGSKDNTWQNIQKLFIHNNVSGIRFTKNFGKESAIFAGLKYFNGDCALVIDADLQHPPQYIPEMYKLWQEGYSIINGVKTPSKTISPIHNIFSKSFNKIMSRQTGIDMSNSSDFKLLDKKVVNMLNSLPESKTFFRALVAWSGFKSYDINFEVDKRIHGKTQWNLSSLIKYALFNLTSFTGAPTQIVSIFGIVFLAFSLIMFVQTLVNWAKGNAIEGFTTIILLQLICSGFIMLGIGICGYYINLIYNEVKQRPRYLIGDIYIKNNNSKEL